MLRAAIINVRNLESYEGARVSTEFIAYGFEVPWPLPAAPHLNIKSSNIPLQFILPGLVAYGTQMAGDRAGKQQRGSPSAWPALLKEPLF